MKKIYTTPWKQALDLRSTNTSLEQISSIICRCDLGQSQCLLIHTNQQHYSRQCHNPYLQRHRKYSYLLNTSQLLRKVYSTPRALTSEHIPHHYDTTSHLGR